MVVETVEVAPAVVSIARAEATVLEAESSEERVHSASVCPAVVIILCPHQGVQHAVPVEVVPTAERAGGADLCWRSFPQF